MGGDYRERTETVARFRDEIAPVPGHARRDVHTLETKVAKQDFDAISRRQYFGRHGLTSWPSLQPLDRCPHAEVGFYDGARTGPNSVVPRMFTMSQLHLNEQTSTETTRRSHRCRLRTHAPQQHACYSITSSARASTVGGSSKPIAFAVLRLMTSSYLFGACTGSSAGFSPLRMRSTYPAARRY